MLPFSSAWTVIANVNIRINSSGNSSHPVLVYSETFLMLLIANGKTSSWLNSTQSTLELVYMYYLHIPVHVPWYEYLVDGNYYCNFYLLVFFHTWWWFAYKYPWTKPNWAMGNSCILNDYVFKWLISLGK